MRKKIEQISAINGILDPINANQGNSLLGWDSDEFPFNVYETTMCMYEVLKAGGLTGAFSFDARNRRLSYGEWSIGSKISTAKIIAFFLLCGIIILISFNPIC